MSTDTFRVRVHSIEGERLTFRILTLPGGGLANYATSRSFVLMLLADASRRAGELPDRRAVKSAPRYAPLIQELDGADLSDKEWMQENVGLYVTSVCVTARHNCFDEQTLKARWDAIDAAGLNSDVARWWDEVHWFEIEAEATDRMWLRHVDVGMEFDTTAYDSWSPDPCSTERA